MIDGQEEGARTPGPGEHTHQRTISAPYLILWHLKAIPVVPVATEKGMPALPLCCASFYLKMYEDFERSFYKSRIASILFSARNFCPVFILFEYLIAKFQTCCGKQVSRLEQQYLKTI